MVIIRRADPSDSRTLWEWRNDPVARAASLDTNPVPWKDHERWFTASLANPSRVILIGIDDDAKIGMVRFDFDDERSAMVSINVAPQRRGMGIGHRLLHAAISHLRRDHPSLELRAQIRVSNAASTRMFQREGFIRLSEVDGVVTLRMP